MARKHRRTLGSRTYNDFTKEALQEALTKIKNKEMTQRQAEAAYNISRSTLKRKLKKIHMKTVGRPTAFSCEEESIFVNYIIFLSAAGFPLDSMDLRLLAKSYLDRRGRKVASFIENTPGVEWVRSFLKRHPQLSNRFASNIKCQRAAVSEEIINSYFDNLEREVRNVEPCNIWNYDETNLTDDSGKKKVIMKRGSKYPERIINSSKSAIYLMFCGNAEGELLPPYTVFKAEAIWSTWCENGPLGARCTKSGWFDTVTFEDWFVSLVLPRLKKQDGVKILIGDNLSSHLNVNVIDLCAENNIKFISLPPNSTHLTQPLDVAYFRAMKGAWRNFLETFKLKGSGKRASSIPKDCFPRLLKELMHQLQEEGNGKTNLISGFKKTGIVPLDRNKIISSLPLTNVELIKNVVNESVLDVLKELRQDSTAPRKRRKRINVVPGKSISAKDLEKISDENQKSGKKKSKASIQNKKKKRTEETSDSSSESTEYISDTNSDSTLGLDSSKSDMSDLVHEDINHPSTSHSSGTGNSSTVSSTQVVLKVNDFVIFNYEGEYFPGKIIRMQSEGATISSMAMSGSAWKWPEKKDEMLYKLDDIVVKINEPTQSTSRAIFKVPEMNVFRKTYY